MLLLCSCRAIFNRTHPYVLDRNLTIRSSAPPELGQMDFRFLTRKVLLAKDITLRLDNLVLRNINKLGGFGVDFFMVRRCACDKQRQHAAAVAACSGSSGGMQQQRRRQHAAAATAACSSGGGSMQQRRRQHAAAAAAACSSGDGSMQQRRRQRAAAAAYSSSSAA
jgi:hypothetical protein